MRLERQAGLYQKSLYIMLVMHEYHEGFKAREVIKTRVVRVLFYDI